MLVLQILFAEMIHVIRSKDHESIQTFLADRLHEPFDVCICAGSPVRIANWFNVTLLKGFQKPLCELRVPVMLHRPIGSFSSLASTMKDLV